MHNSRQTAWRCVVLAAVLALAAGCRRDAGTMQQKGTAMTITITSAAFDHNQPIPRKYTGDGEDLSPPLSFSGVPAGTAQLALICDDPDAPRPKPWVHWVIYNIPGDTAGLVEGVPKSAELTDPRGAIQGMNSWPKTGYGGPAPPRGHGVHHYHFKLYALDAALNLPGGFDKDELLEAIDDHILATGELIGTYERRPRAYRRTCCQSLSRRLAETGTAVRSSWANSDTRSSSSIQRYCVSIGSTMPASRCAAARSAYACQRGVNSASCRRSRSSPPCAGFSSRRSIAAR